MTEKKKKVHFTGIKGVGMAAAALCFQDLGWLVTGSDVADRFVTDEILEKRKIEVFEGFDANRITASLDLLVYTGAHKGPQNVEVIAANEKGITVISHASSVNHLMSEKYVISVCGVGGKTTTSGMIATMLEKANKNPSYLIGVGAIKGLDYPGKMTNGELFVAEADEYSVAPGSEATPRFMYHTPAIIVCTNLAYDHPDAFNSFEDTKTAFENFFNMVSVGGWLVINGDDAELVALAKKIPHKLITFGVKPGCDWQLLTQKYFEGGQEIMVRFGENDATYRLNVIGTHNAMNAMAAMAVGHLLGMEADEINSGLGYFGGTKRRLEVIANKDGIVYLDDYAHHPLEIKAVIGAVKDSYPKKRLVVAFQPHTYSRTKALFEEFGVSFPGADSVIVTDIFASAREEIDESVNGEMLANQIVKSGQKAIYVNQDGLVEYIRKNLRADDVFLTMGAGDVYKIHEKIFNK